MTARPWLRKLVLTLHITASVGWLGAVAGFLPLAVVSLTNQEVQTVRSAYLMMDLAARFVLLPLSLTSLLTGLILSLITPWGLFRHYWVLFTLGINVFAVAVLLKYTQTLGLLASAAASGAELHQLRDPSSVLHSAAALLLLLVAVALSVYKPAGVTPYGWRKQLQRRA